MTHMDRLKAHPVVCSCLCFLVLVQLASAAGAQLEAASEGRVAMGHHHLNVPDLEASSRFWVEQLGAESTKLGPLVVMKLPNVLVVLREQEPSGSSFGSSVNHIGLQFPDIEVMVRRLEANGSKIVTKQHIAAAEGKLFEVPDQNTRVAFVEGPSGVRVELFENKALSRPVENHHIHFYTEDPVATRDWYVEHFGAKSGKRGSFEAADLPGVNLTFSEGATSGTEGRALDHIGFEVDDLEGLCRALEEAGVVFDRPYTKIDALGLEIAFFTDPWGTYVELTEGLDDI